MLGNLAIEKGARWVAGLSLVTAAAVTLTGSSAGYAAAATTGGPAQAAKSCGHRCPLPRFGPGMSYHPKIDPLQFSPNVTNQLFPLKVGTTLVYSGTKDGKLALDLVAVTARTKRIDGVRTRVVEDRLYLSNILEERTSDYYAQDRCGNVWYFGEDTATLDAHGRVTSREGSFHAGVNGAQPGVFMQAVPQLQRRFRQEWSPGQAEDTFKAVQRNAKITVPFGSFGHALRTAESTALEPDVLDNKYYVAGIGEVTETSLTGPLERLDLVEIIS